ncbi:MAG: UDP-N-acetylglucosamine 2-epimerase (non-hydrolyzing) [Endomicrobiales bacterium]|nr:UDP-N-acetylglucosamine 2-epimerase (non-hydrolyzing) [Endomicrobiales bacterium]
MGERKKKILIVFGTRPEAIKMAPVLKAFRTKSYFDVKVCVSAQHRTMLDEVLELFKITPDYDLNIMQSDQNLYHITANTLLKMEAVLEREKPDMVFVHGDTTTTFAATLAAFYKKIPVAHVEAGLRTCNKFEPFPEEANRVLTDALSTICFAPTAQAKAALLKEGIENKKIFVTGNTVIDALNETLKRNLDFKNSELKKICHGSGKIMLLTAHRRENFGKPMENIFQAIKKIALKHPEIKIIYPVHLNPNVQTPAKKILGNVKNIYLLPPLTYGDLTKLMQRSYLVITDSGGIQEEAPALAKPVLVLRNITERPEAVAAGTVKLVGSNKEKVFLEIEKLLNNTKAYSDMAKTTNPYGDGMASKRILYTVENYFGVNKNSHKGFQWKA